MHGQLNSAQEAAKDAKGAAPASAAETPAATKAVVSVFDDFVSSMRFKGYHACVRVMCKRALLLLHACFYVYFSHC